LIPVTCQSLLDMISSIRSNPGKQPTMPAPNRANPATRPRLAQDLGASSASSAAAPWRAGQHAKAIHALQIREANAGRKGSVILIAERSTEEPARSNRAGQPRGLAKDRIFGRMS
jgi:hypothetical protein